jgi:hypothetical protein
VRFPGSAPFVGVVLKRRAALASYQQGAGQFLRLPINYMKTTG